MAFFLPMIELEMIKNLIRPRRKRVLVAEDDLTLQPILRQILLGIDSRAELIWVTTVEEAKEKVRNERFDLVIADYFLSADENGLDLWNYCEDHRPDTPFLLMSGLEENLVGKLVDGHHSIPPYLRKPFQPSLCKSRLQEMLQ